MGKQYLFSDRKKGIFYNKIFYIALIAVFICGIYMLKGNADADISEPDNYPGNDILTNVQASTDIEGNRNKGDNNVVNAKDEAYYLLKEAEGLIELYYYDENGKEKLLRVTDIPFNLISDADQEYFEKGVIVKDEAELNEILQDFES